MGLQTEVANIKLDVAAAITPSPPALLPMTVNSFNKRCPGRWGDGYRPYIRKLRTGYSHIIQEGRMQGSRYGIIYTSL
jgi:hypothetical protein